MDFQEDPLPYWYRFVLIFFFLPLYAIGIALVIVGVGLGIGYGVEFILSRFGNLGLLALGWIVFAAILAAITDK